MNLADRMRNLRRAHSPFLPTSTPFVPDTADELYSKVEAEIILRVRHGCSTFSFEWDYHHSEDPVEWEKYRLIREEVVARLREEGINAVGKPESFPKAERQERHGEVWMSTPIGHHYIDAKDLGLPLVHPAWVPEIEARVEAVRAGTEPVFGEEEVFDNTVEPYLREGERYIKTKEELRNLPIGTRLGCEEDPLADTDRTSGPGRFDAFFTKTGPSLWKRDDGCPCPELGLEDEIGRLVITDAEE